MPELPEVEHLRRTLARALPGRRVRSVTLHRADICSPARPGRAPAPRDLLRGATFTDPERRGKQLALRTREGRILVVQLGMTGQLLLAPSGRTSGRGGSPAPTHVHAEWRLDDGRVLMFRDPRRFGGLTALPSAGALAERWSSLGPDAAAITGEALMSRLAGTRRAIKAALLDQAVLAGVGNIYADEALFRAGIHPLVQARRLRDDQAASLAAAIRETLAIAIGAGGSTLRDYVDSNGAPGRYQLSHLVYGHAGEPCGRCGARLRGIPVAQRTTVFCPACQRLRGSRSC